MSSISEMVASITQGNESLKESEFYKEYLLMSKEYDKMIVAGFSKKPEQILSSRMEDFQSELVTFNRFA